MSVQYAISAVFPENATSTSKSYIKDRPDLDLAFDMVDAYVNWKEPDYDVTEAMRDAFSMAIMQYVHQNKAWEVVRSVKHLPTLQVRLLMRA